MFNVQGLQKEALIIVAKELRQNVEQNFAVVDFLKN